MPNKSAFIPFNSRLYGANNAAPLPVDIPNTNEPYYGVQQYGPSVEVPNAGTQPNYPTASIGPQYPGYANNPVTGGAGFGAPGGTYETGGYNDPSGSYWPNTTVSDAPSFWSKFLSGAGRIGTGIVGSTVGGLGGPAGSLAGGIAGKKLGDKLFPAPHDKTTFVPGGPSDYQGPAGEGLGPNMPTTDAGFDALGYGLQRDPVTGQVTRIPVAQAVGKTTPRFVGNGPHPGSAPNYTGNIGYGKGIGLGGVTMPGVEGSGAKWGGQSQQATDLGLMAQQANGGAANRYEPDEPGYNGEYFNDHPDAIQLPRTAGGMHNTNQFPNVAAVVAASGINPAQLQGLYGNRGTAANVGAGTAAPVLSDATNRFLANLAARRAQAGG